MSNQSDRPTFAQRVAVSALAFLGSVFLGLLVGVSDAPAGNRAPR